MSGELNTRIQSGGEGAWPGGEVALHIKNELEEAVVLKLDGVGQVLCTCMHVFIASLKILGCPYRLTS